MQVFRIYFKIIKKQLGQLSIYIGVFLAMAIMFSFTSPTSSIDDFTQSKTRVAFINEDENSILIEGFKEYLGNHSVYVPIQNEMDKLQDALFFRDVDYIAKIPMGFTKGIIAGKNSQIEKTVVSGSTSSIYTDMLVNKYFNTVKLYLSSYKDITQEELVKQVAKDLKIETKVQMKRTGEKSANTGNIKYFFNYLAYVLISVIVLGVSSIMMVFNNTNLRRRNLCSPIKNASINLQILLGNIIFSTVCWGLLIGVSFILYRGQMLTTNAIYFCINSFVFTLTALSMSFLVGILIKSRNAQSGISNVLSLGLCFLSGVFVPQEFLSENVLAMAKFTPTYWFVKANNDIGNLSNFSMDNLSPVFMYMLIELGFAVAIVSVALVMSKRKQLKGS
ncbi:MAG TPA: ABC transporter permease [Ruminiclostridium sp.]